MTRRRITIILVSVVVVLAAAAGGYFIVRSINLSREETKREKIANTPTVPPEKIAEIQARTGTNGKIVSIDTAKKTILLAEPVSGQRLDPLKYTDKTTVHKGVSAEQVPFSTLKTGQIISITYNVKTGLIEDIWYE